MSQTEVEATLPTAGKKSTYNNTYNDAVYSAWCGGRAGSNQHIPYENILIASLIDKDYNDLNNSQMRVDDDTTRAAIIDGFNRTIAKLDVIISKLDLLDDDIKKATVAIYDVNTDTESMDRKLTLANTKLGTSNAHLDTIEDKIDTQTHRIDINGDKLDIISSNTANLPSRSDVTDGFDRMGAKIDDVRTAVESVDSTVAHKEFNVYEHPGDK